jgi:hypothetical protein
MLVDADKTSSHPRGGLLHPFLSKWKRPGRAWLKPIQSFKGLYRPVRKEELENGGQRPKEIGVRKGVEAFGSNSKLKQFTGQKWRPKQKAGCIPFAGKRDGIV